MIKEVKNLTEGYDTKELDLVLKQVRREHPENQEVTVSSENDVPYQELITVMDLCLDNGLEGIQVAGLES